MEMKKMHKFFGLADFLDEQKFLEKQHRLGWKFIKFRPLTKYTFEKCEPEDYIYQLDYKEDDQDEEEYIQIFIDCGWEYIMKYQTWYYFRKPKSEVSVHDNEIFSDKESKIEMMQKIMKRLFMPIFIFFLFPSMLFFTKAIQFNGKDKIYIGIMIFYSVIMALLLCLYIYNAVKLNHLIRTIENK